MIKRLAAAKNVQGALSLLALLLIFFSTPLTHLSDSVYSPADLGQIYAPLNLDLAYWPANTLPFDVLQMIHPWFLLSRDQVRHGQVPLWNPLNGGGTPLMANFQSGVFSIFTVPYYVLPFEIAAPLAGLLKLFSVGFLTFLFLKRIGLSQLSALFGGNAFMFAGHNILWLAWPNTGVVVALIGGLYFTECALTTRHRWPFIGLTLSLSAGLLAGNPETFYFCVLPLPIYFLFRAAWLLRQSDDVIATRRHLWSAATGCALAAIIAAGLCAIQLIPFFEYLANGAAPLRRKESWQLVLQTQFWPLSIFPDVLGNPGQRAALNLIGLLDPAQVNYNEVNSLYVGGTTLLLAAIGVPLLRRMKQSIYYGFFGIGALVWLLFAMNVLNVRALLNLIPGMSLAPFTRSIPIPLLVVCCCAAFSFESISTAIKEYRSSWLIPLSIGAVTLIICVFGAYSLINTQSGALIARLPVSVAQVESHAATLLTHLNGLIIVFGAGLGVISLLWLSRSQRARTGLGIALIGIVFAETGYMLKDQNPTIPRGLFYPDTSAIEQIKTLSRDTPLLVTGSSLLTANLNIPYGISLVSSYDAMDIRYYDELAAVMFGAPGPSHTVTNFDERGLQLFNISTVITNDVKAYAGASVLSQVAEQRFYNVYRYDRVLPRFRVVYQAGVESDDQATLERIQGADFDPVQMVILNDGLTLKRQTGVVDHGIEMPCYTQNLPVQSMAIHCRDIVRFSSGTLSTSGVDGVAVTVNTETSTTLDLTAPADQPGYLLLAKTFYPGWKAKVNGVAQPVLRANYAFSAIPLPKGENHVEFYYDPDSFKIGAAISLGSALLGVLFMALHIRR